MVLTQKLKLSKVKDSKHLLKVLNLSSEEFFQYIKVSLILLCPGKHIGNRPNTNVINILLKLMDYLLIMSQLAMTVIASDRAQTPSPLPLSNPEGMLCTCLGPPSGFTTHYPGTFLPCNPHPPCPLSLPHLPSINPNFLQGKS
jgi:hypothetical protein